MPGALGEAGAEADAEGAAALGLSESVAVGATVPPVPLAADAWSPEDCVNSTTVAATTATPNTAAETSRPVRRPERRSGCAVGCSR